MRLYQYYNTNDDSDRDIYKNNWSAQTFTPQADQLLGAVKLKLFRTGTPGTITVSLRNTQNGKPVGGDLCSGTIEGENITDNTSGEWYEISLGDGYNLDVGTQYAIVVKAPTGDTSNKLSWRADITSPTFTGGTHCSSTDSGVDWGTISGVDTLFECWGVGPMAPTTITWGSLVKSQVSSETIEEAIQRFIDEHEADENAHLGEGESLQSHRTSEIIDHIAESIITDKIAEGEITNPKIDPIARAYTAIVKTGITEEETLRPNGEGSETNLYPWPDTNDNWENVDDEDPPDTETVVLTTNQSSFERDLYSLPSYTDTQHIEGVKVTVRCLGNTNLNEGGYAKPAIKTHSTVYEGDEKYFDNSWENYSYYWTLNPNTGEPWTTEEINALEAGVALKAGSAAGNFACTQVFVTVVRRTQAGTGIYGTIQAAIEYIKALNQNGGGILILPGTYNPNASIVLYSNIDLIGLDPKTTIINFEEDITKRMEAIGEESPYSTGTIGVTKDSDQVSGSGTSWTNNVSAGDYIKINDTWFKIESVDDNTTITLERKYRGKIESGLSYNAATMVENIELKGITIKGGGSTDSGDNPGNVYFKYFKNCRVINCQLLDATGISFWAVRGTELIFKDNIPGGKGQAGVAFNFINNSLIDNNHAGGSAEWDFSFTGCKKCTISNNSSPGCGYDGFVFYSCKNCDIHGNTSENNNQSGFEFYGSSEYNSIRGNKAINNSGDGLLLTGDGLEGYASYNSISENIAEGNGEHGIDIANAGSSKNILIANELRNNSSGGINDSGTNTETAHNITS